MNRASSPGEPVAITVSSEDAGTRFDHLAAAHIQGCSRTHAARLIRDGMIRIDDAVKKPGYRVAAGERITGHLPPPEQPHFSPEPIEIDVLYQDAAMIVINKPPGLVVHPAPGHTGGTLAHGLLFRFPELEQVGPSPERPGIVHRLDKDTSGILIAARTESAYRHLKSGFQNRSVEKTYLAVVYGNPRESGGSIALPIARHPVHRKRMAAGVKEGRQALTCWKVVRNFEGISLLEFDIKTGRTHQIRVHASAMKHPVVGDPVYGFRNPERAFSLPPETARRIREHVRRQLLHAWKIALIHPDTGQRVSFEAPIPADMAGLIDSMTKSDHSGS